MSIVTIAILILLVLVLTWLIYQLVWGKPPAINLAVERIALRMVKNDPETLTMLGLLDNTPLDFHSGGLTDASPAYMANLRQLDRDGLVLIKQYDPAKLKGQKRITYDLMRWYFEQNLRGHRFDYHWAPGAVFMGPYPVNHVYGVQIDLINFLTTYHKISGKRSVRRYLRRLHMVGWKIDGLLESLALCEGAGAIPPRFVIEKCLRQVESFLADPFDENPLYTSFVEKVRASKRLGERTTQVYGSQVITAIQETVAPAYQKLSNYLQGWLDKATDDDGVWKLPGGEDYYAFLLRHHTTSEMTADEIHQLGLDEVGRLTESVCEIFDRMGLPCDSPGEQLKAMMKVPQHHFIGENKRDDIRQAYQDILDEVNIRLPEIFSFGSLDQIVVKRLPEFREPDSPIAYAEAPSMDGKRPGTMWINLREPDNVYRWGMRTLAYHEGIPGHVYQLAHAQKIKGLPTFRKTYFFNAYVEGWALYAERLGWELGLEDDLSNLGRLQGLLWRAARLVVDTGLHARQWTRQQAIDYMLEKTGLPERDVVSEVERYIVAPGQACAYYIGYLKMLALRRKAEAALGEAFDIKEFHDVIINQGGLPLSILENVVNDYIDRAAGLGQITLTQSN